MSKLKNKKNELIIYQSKTGKIEFRGDFRKDTIWGTQQQIAQLFGTQRPAITKHLNNIFKTKELLEKSVSSILEHTADDGKVYKTKFYNPSFILYGKRSSFHRRQQEKWCFCFHLVFKKSLKSYTGDFNSFNLIGS